MYRAFLLSLVLLCGVSAQAVAQACSASGVVVQTLGTGGPGHSASRASTSNLLWVEGRARVLLDLGGGSQLRYAQSGARSNDLALVAVSHFHPDHISDLPAWLWSTRNTPRPEPLTIVGPSGNATAPGLIDFLRRLFDPQIGAFQVLSPVLAPPPDWTGLRFSPAPVDAAGGPVTVFDRSGLTVRALPIPHGPIPTIAYRVQVGAVSVVFSSDQTGADPRFVDFAKGTDLLLMHLNIPPGPSNDLHASPATVGRVATAVGPKRLIVSHLGLPDVDAAVAELRKEYTGPLTVASDMLCTPVN